uniref:Glycosyltransferase 2-like domain-containing protein n=1 Tax=Catagonus wagneri TaxID=51154 RepID=A0A8C3WF38_9CETA
MAIIDKWKEKLEAAGILVVIGGHDSPSPRGVGYSKNQAIAQSSGTYLCFLDSDDVMMPQRVRLQLAAAVQHPTSIVGCQVQREPPSSTQRYTRWVNQLQPGQLLTQAFTSHGPTVLMPTWFCSRAWFSRVGPFDEGGRVSAPGSRSGWGGPAFRPVGPESTKASRSSRPRVLSLPDRGGPAARLCWRRGCREEAVAPGTRSPVAPAWPWSLRLAEGCLRDSAGRGAVRLLPPRALGSRWPGSFLCTLAHLCVGPHPQGSGYTSLCPDTGSRTLASSVLLFLSPDSLGVNSQAALRKEIFAPP